VRPALDRRVSGDSVMGQPWKRQPRRACHRLGGAGHRV